MDPEYGDSMVDSKSSILSCTEVYLELRYSMLRYPELEWDVLSNYLSSSVGANQQVLVH